MSDKHTQGKLNLHETVIGFTGGGGFDMRGRDDAAANARRIVACWNAFDKVPTGLVEKLCFGGGAGATQVKASAYAIEELVAARGLLAEILAADDKAIANMSQFVGEHQLNIPANYAAQTRPFAERIRALLEGGTP